MRTIAVFLVALLSLQSAPAPERIPWERSADHLAGKYVLVDLKDGTRLEGYWGSVTADSFTMQGKRGLKTAPRSAIARVRAGKRRTRGRVIGTIAGMYSVVGIAAASQRSPDALQGGWGLAFLIGGVAGYFAGKSFDHETREIVFEPKMRLILK